MSNPMHLLKVDWRVGGVLKRKQTNPPPPPTPPTNLCHRSPPYQTVTEWCTADAESNPKTRHLNTLVTFLEQTLYILQLLHPRKHRRKRREQRVKWDDKPQRIVIPASNRHIAIYGIRNKESSLIKNILEIICRVCREAEPT